MSNVITTTRSVADGMRLAQATTQSRVQATMARLATGVRANAASAVGGLPESLLLGAQVRSIAQATQGMEETASLTQVAVGGLDEISDLLSRQRDLAVKAGSSGDVSLLQDLDAQMKELGTAIDRIAKSTIFQNTRLLDGSFVDGTIQVGVLTQDRASLTIASTVTGDKAGFDRAGLGVDGVSAATTTDAQRSIGPLDAALTSVADQRATLGQVHTRVSSVAMSSLSDMLNGLSQTPSRIMDADFANETVNFTRNQILVQSGVGMLTPDAPRPQSVLNLLR